METGLYVHICVRACLSTRLRVPGYVGEWRCTFLCTCMDCALARARARVCVCVCVCACGCSLVFVCLLCLRVFMCVHVNVQCSWKKNQTSPGTACNRVHFVEKLSANISWGIDLDSVAGGSRWRLTNCKMATLACPQLSDRECYTRRTYLFFSNPYPWVTYKLITVNKKEAQLNHIYFILFYFILFILFTRALVQWVIYNPWMHCRTTSYSYWQKQMLWILIIFKLILHKVLTWFSLAS